MHQLKEKTFAKKESDKDNSSISSSSVASSVTVTPASSPYSSLESTPTIPIRNIVAPITSGPSINTNSNFDTTDNHGDNQDDDDDDDQESNYDSNYDEQAMVATIPNKVYQILVVDDEPNSKGLVLKMKIKQWANAAQVKYKAENAVNGFEGFQKCLFERKPYDLVIMDRNMPAVAYIHGGFQCAFAIQTVFPSTFPTRLIMGYGWDWDEEPVQENEQNKNNQNNNKKDSDDNEVFFKRVRRLETVRDFFNTFFVNREALIAPPLLPAPKILGHSADFTGLGNLLQSGQTFACGDGSCFDEVLREVPSRMDEVNQKLNKLLQPNVTL